MWVFSVGAAEPTQRWLVRGGMTSVAQRAAVSTHASPSPLCGRPVSRLFYYTVCQRRSTSFSGDRHAGAPRLLRGTRAILRRRPALPRPLLPAPQVLAVVRGLWRVLRLPALQGEQGEQEAL